MNHELDKLNAIEKSTVADLFLNDFRDCSQVNIVDKNLSFGERALKKRKISKTSSAYMDLRFIRPTSNMCERLFSVAGFTLNDRCKCILAMNFELQFFCMRTLNFGIFLMSMTWSTDPDLVSN